MYYHEIVILLTLPEYFGYIYVKHNVFNSEY